MAGLLVRCKEHWMDSLPQEEKDKLINDEGYISRSQIGDIVCVYIDEQCSENPSKDTPFIIVMIPDEVEDVKYLEEIARKDIDKTMTQEVSKASYDSAMAEKVGKTAEQLKSASSLASAKTVTIKEEKADSYVVDVVRTVNTMVRHRKHYVDPAWVKKQVADGNLRVEVKSLDELNITEKIV